LLFLFVWLVGWLVLVELEFELRALCSGALPLELFDLVILEMVVSRMFAWTGLKL
jgi:hypothetical protein